jgi:hypothetical protein
MARIIPNENTWVGFTTSAIANTAAPTVAVLAAAVNLTPLLISLNASARGNSVPTPSFDSLFETSTAGTSTATFDADFYRDDVTLSDLAWTTLPRNTRGFFLISRFGGSGASNLPIAADKVEVWPVMVTSRTMANMSNNTVLTFSVNCAVTSLPNEAATVT